MLLTVVQSMNKLTADSARRIHAFGYNRVNLDNIFTDYAYASFFHKLIDEISRDLPEQPMNPENKVSIQRYKTAIKILKRKIENLHDTIGHNHPNSDTK